MTLKEFAHLIEEGSRQAISDDPFYCALVAQKGHTEAEKVLHAPGAPFSFHLRMTEHFPVPSAVLLFTLDLAKSHVPPQRIAEILSQAA